MRMTEGYPGIIEAVTRTQLSAVPVEYRRRAAIGLGLMAALLATAGILPWTAAAPASIRVLAVAALAAAALAALIAWGLARSTTLDARRQAEAQLDQALIAAAGGVACDCGHDHAADGTLHAVSTTDEKATCGAPQDADCPHTCESCVLAQLR
jgi:hypothetical protein